MKKAIALLIGLIMAAGLAGAADVTVKIRGCLFSPSDADFKTIYGGGLQVGAEVEISLIKGIGIFLGADYFGKTGKIIFTEEATDLALIPLEAGAFYRYGVGPGGFSVGAGLHYVIFHEKNVLGTANAGGLGFEAKAEGFLNVAPTIRVFVYGKFSSCSMTPVDLTFNAGGLEFGAGLGFKI
jgi:hypothetical protein